MNNYGSSIEATETAMNSSGSAMKENERYLESYEAKLNMVKNRWTETTLALQEDILGDVLVGFTTVGTGFLEMLTTIIDKIGLIPTVFALAGAGISGFSSKMQALDMANILGLNFNSWGALGTSIKETTQLLRLYGGELTVYTAKTKAAEIAMRAFGVAGRFTLGVLSTLSKIVLPTALFWGLGQAISWVTTKISDHREEQERLAKNLETTKESIRTNKHELEHMIVAYDKLDALGTERNNEQEQEYLDLQEKIATALPEMVSGENDKGESILANTDIMREYIDVMDEKLQRENEEKLKSVDTNLDSSYGAVNDLRNEITDYEKEIEGLEENLVRALEEGDEAREISIRTNIMNLEDDILENFSDIDEEMTELAEHLETVFNSLDFDLGGDKSWVAEVAQEYDLASDAVKTLAERVHETRETLTADVGLGDFDVQQFNEVFEVVRDFEGGGSAWEEYSAQLRDAGITSEQVGEILGNLKYTTDDLTKMASDAGFVLGEMVPEFDKFGNVTGWVAEQQSDLADDMEGTTDAIGDQAEAIGELDEATESYNESISKIKDHNKILEELDEGNLSAESIGLIMEKYEEFLPYIEDEIALKEALGEAVKDETAIAKQAIQEKLMGNEDYLNFVIKDHQDFYNFLNDSYDVDLNNFKDLASAKEAVENELISSLTGKWADYLQVVDGAVTETQEGFWETAMMDEMATLSGDPDNDPKLNKFKSDMEKHKAALQKEVDDVQARFDSVTIDLTSTDFSGIGRSISDTGKKTAKDSKKKSKEKDKEVKESTYVADDYKQALEMLNLELERQNSIQSKAATHSKEYRDSLQKELKLLEKKRDLIKEQSRSLEKQIKAGKIDETGIVTTSQKVPVSAKSATKTTASGSGTQASIWNFLSSKGLSDNIVAGIMGNLKMESNFNANALNASSGAFGIAQWLGGRKSSLQNFASSRGTSASDLQTQLDFLWKELNSTEKRTLNWLKSNQNASSATVAAQFDKLFERSEGTHIPQRQQYASQILGKFGGSGGSKGAFAGVSHAESTEDLSEISREIAQNAANVDSAKSDLIGYELELLKLNDEIAEIPYLIVESHIEAFDHAMDKLDKEMSKIDYYQTRYEEFTPEWSKYQFQREKNIEKQNKQHEASIKFIEKEIKSNKNLTREQKKRLDDELLERQSELWNLEKRILDERIKMADQLIKVYKDSLSAQKDAALASIDEMIKEIDEKEKEADYKRRLKNEQGDRQEILDEISQWSIDDSDMAKKRVKELTEQLQEIDEVIEDMQHQKGLDDRKDALESEKDEISDKYDNLIEDEQAFSDMRSKIIKGNTKSIQKDLQSFYKRLGGMTEELGDSVVKNLQRSIDQMNSHIRDSNFNSVNVPHFDTGGMARVKSSAGGLAVVHDKEHIFKPDDTSDLLKTVELAKGLFHNLRAPKFTQLATESNEDNSATYDIDVNIESMNGTQRDVDTFMSNIAKGVKKRGGRMN